MKIYSIYNSELGYFNRPIFYESDAEVKQYILNVLCADSDRALSNLKEVLELYCIGDIDFTTGIITPCSATLVCALNDLWHLVPTDRIPRDSLELGKKISALSEELSLFKKDLYSRNPKIKKGEKI